MKIIKKANSFIQVCLKKGIVYIFSGSVLIKFISFFSSIVLIRLITKEDYGILASIENLYGYLHLIMGFGLGNAFLRFIVLSNTMQQKLGWYKYLVNAGTKNNIVILVLLFLVSNFFLKNTTTYVNSNYIMIFCLALPFQYLAEANTLTYRSLQLYRTYGSATVLIVFIVVGIRLIFVYFFGLFGAVVSFTLAYLIISIILIRYTLVKVFKGIEQEKIFDKQKCIAKKYSFHFMITNGIWTLFLLNDIFFLNFFLKDASLVAEYKVASVLPANLSIISQSVAIFITPFFISNENNKGWIKEKFLYLVLLLFISIGIICLLLNIFSVPIIAFLFGENYHNVSKYMELLLVVGFVNSVFRGPMANILSAVGKVKYNLYVSLMGLLLQIVFDIILIPIFGIWGVIFSNLTAYLMMTIVLLIIFNKQYHLLDQN